MEEIFLSTKQKQTKNCFIAWEAMRLNLSDFKQKFDDCSTLYQCSLRKGQQEEEDVKSLVRDEREKATCVFCRDLQ